MEQPRKIRVLETIRQGKIGGGESHVLDLVKTMDSELFEPVVLSFTDGPMVQALTAIGVPVHVIASEKAFDISIWKKVRAFLTEQRIDIVHVHGTRANTNVMWAARRLGLPLIYTIHGWSFHDGLNPLIKRARIAAEKYITRKAKVNICVSDSNRETGIKTFGRFDSVVIKNGVNPVKFNPGAAYPDVKAAYGIPADQLVIGYIARMTLQKDPVGMLEGFSLALQQFPDMKLLMIGEGELKEAALDAARRLNITDHVIFDNFRQDVPAVLNGVDIYCLPSLWEGFPIGVLEAMAMGKAVIASDVDGTREAVTDGDNGLLVPAKNSETLAAAIVKLAKDKTLRAQLQQRAMDTIRSKYTVSGMTRQIEKIYQQLYHN
ncbi:glycosyltransferase family 4 protein [Chitinophaga niabensis]|uniref:Glycosyltransferase involved in cell wall bisynthesis n=1 Tax=Chitinophaga niabensis TaxID=536979 RepID=A0A1N6EF09_9BACT|nr:glycosyltransferase family 4 protein [Chitinophaga niabensis]SIN81594.1 Glycosyltransferase involved in cell wall bisynthesis [Chitinophaga niabensis]